MIGPDAMLRHTISHEYTTWLREERGLADATIDALVREARFSWTGSSAAGALSVCEH